MNLSPPLSSLDAKVAEIVAMYPVSKRSASMPVLHLIQETYGYICPEAIEWAAKKLDLQPINLLEVVTFYPMYRQQPVGKFHIKVCRTLPCALRGSEELCEHILKKLNVGLDENTPDGKFTVSHVECIASCGTAPVIQINEDFHEGVTLEKADALISKCS